MPERGLEVRGIKALVKVVEVHTVIIHKITVQVAERAGIVMETMMSPAVGRAGTEELGSWVVMVDPVLLMTTVDLVGVVVRVVTGIRVVEVVGTPEEVPVRVGQGGIGVVVEVVVHITLGRLNHYKLVGTPYPPAKFTTVGSQSRQYKICTYYT